MFSTPKRSTKHATTLTCPPPPPARTRRSTSPSPSTSLGSSFTSTTSSDMGSIFSKVDLCESSSTFDLNGLTFTPPRPPAYPCLSFDDEDDVHRHAPAMLKPRPSRQERY